MKITMVLTSAVMASTALFAAPPGAANTNVISHTGHGKQNLNFGVIEEGKQILGADLRDRANKSIGKIDDVVLDLESTKILYAIASLTGSGDHFAIAPSVLMPQRATNIVRTTVEPTKLTAAPKVDMNNTNNLGSGAFITQVAQAFGVSSDVDPNGSFNNVHKLSQLSGATVKDTSNADFGKIDDVIVDLHGGHAPFVILTRAGAFYAIPPNAFTLAADKSTLVTGLDQNVLNTAPKYTKGNVQMLSNPATAAGIYSHYGKQPYFQTGILSPTSRTNSPSQVFPLTK